MYCEKCRRIIQEDQCPFCKKSIVREPDPEDLCLLTELDYISSGILEDVLQQNSIPFLKKGVMGAGLAIKVGPMLDRSRFYVTYDLLDKASDVVDELFAVPEDAGVEYAEEYKRQTEDDPGVDYAEEYRRQTGKDLASGEYTLQ